MNYIKIAKEVFDIEIAGLKEVQNNFDENFTKAIEIILKSKGRVVITGMGKSGLVGKKIVATLASTGTPSFFLHPGEAYHGDLGMIHPEDVVIAISNSGETDELIRLMSFFKDNKNTVLAMTGKKGSTLEKHADLHLNIAVSKEACPLELAPTTSTTVTLAYGDALAMALMQARDFKPENFARFHPGGSLGRKLLVKVKDLMKSKDLPIVKLEDNFESIISVIAEGRLGICVVTGDDNKVLGVITDGDIRRLMQKEKAHAMDARASEFYTQNPKTIDASEKIITAEKMMQDRKITTLIVTENDKLAGILHLYDM